MQGKMEKFTCNLEYSSKSNKL